MSDTSGKTKLSKTQPTEAGSKTIVADDELAFFVAMLARLSGKVAGVRTERTNIYLNGEQVAIVIVNGCIWTDEGDLIVKKNGDDEAE